MRGSKEDRTRKLLKHIIKTESCWLWTKKADHLKGYGRFYYMGTRTPSHRATYEHFKGKIPKGLVIDHLCRNPGCVNPDHLEPVTTRENILRGVSEQAKNARKTICKRGHPLTPGNYFQSTYKRLRIRNCRFCSRIRDNARNLKKRLALKNLS